MKGRRWAGRDGKEEEWEGRGLKRWKWEDKKGEEEEGEGKRVMGRIWKK